MNGPRFFLPGSSIDIKTNAVEISKPELINQIRRVLRLKPQDPIVILNGEGGIYQCRLTVVAQHHVQAKILEAVNYDPQIHPSITVCQALIRGGRFELVLQKLTELGVSTVIPLICEHGVARYSGNKIDHWMEIVREAAEQCERVAIPQVVEPVTVEQLQTRCLTTVDYSSAMKLICLERSRGDTIAEVLLRSSDSATKLPPDQIVLMIGPEGGFSQSEVSCALGCGFLPISLGPRILRSETAAIAATAVLISLWHYPR